MPIKTYVQTQTGSSLIEVLIATVVVGLVVTAIAFGMSHSVRNSAQSRYREVATKLAQDVQESFRKERNRLGWNQFASALSGTTVYCFSNIPAEFTEETLAQAAGACDSGDGIKVGEVNVEYFREVEVVVANGTAQIIVTIEWADDNLQQSLSSEQVLREWN